MATVTVMKIGRKEPSVNLLNISYKEFARRFINHDRSVITGFTETNVTIAYNTGTTVTRTMVIVYIFKVILPDCSWLCGCL